MHRGLAKEWGQRNENPFHHWVLQSDEGITGRCGTGKWAVSGDVSGAKVLDIPVLHFSVMERDQMNCQEEMWTAEKDFSYYHETNSYQVAYEVVSGEGMTK